MPRALAVGLTIAALSVVIVITAASRPSRSVPAEFSSIARVD